MIQLSPYLFFRMNCIFLSSTIHQVNLHTQHIYIEVYIYIYIICVFHNCVLIGSDSIWHNAKTRELNKKLEKQNEYQLRSELQHSNVLCSESQLNKVLLLQSHGPTEDRQTDSIRQKSSYVPAQRWRERQRYLSVSRPLPAPLLFWDG